MWGRGWDAPVVAVEVRERDEQLERVPLGHQRPAFPALVHRLERAVDPPNIRLPSSGGLVLSSGAVAAQTRNFGRTRNGIQRPGLAMSCLMSPDSIQTSAQLVLRQVVRQRLGEHDAVDAAGRRARDHVHHDARADAGLVVLAVSSSRSAQRPPVGVLGFRLLERVVVRVLLVGPRRGHQLLDLLRHAVHVDGERDAAVTDERESQLDRLGVRRRPGYGRDRDRAGLNRHRAAHPAPAERRSTPQRVAGADQLASSSP